MINLLLYSNKPKSPSWIFYSKLLVSNNKLIHYDYSTEVNIPYLANYDIVLLFGSNYDLSEIRAQNKNVIIGHLEPRAAQRNDLFNYDFIIVNSIESQDYFSKYCKSTFLYPTYPILHNKNNLIKKNNPKLVIGYHGNKIHLEAMNYRISNALNDLKNKIDYEFWVMYDIEGLGKWSESGLVGVNVRHIQFDEKNYESYMSKVDIGIVPQLIPVRKNKFLKWAISSFFGKFNERSDNFFFRLKETTNNGRAYVFAQYSIPIVADMTPSSCSLLGENEHGYVAYSESSWYKFLLMLSQDEKLRIKMGNNLSKRFSKIANESNLQNSFNDFLTKLEKK